MIDSVIIDSLMQWARTWCASPRLEIRRSTVAENCILCEVYAPESAAAPLSSLYPIAITRVQ